MHDKSNRIDRYRIAATVCRRALSLSIAAGSRFLSEVDTVAENLLTAAATCVWRRVWHEVELTQAKDTQHTAHNKTDKPLASAQLVDD